MRKIKGSIGQIRELEQHIRATNRYTEGLFTKKVHYPVQGDLSSKAFSRYLEVYLDNEFTSLDWDMSALEFLIKSIDNFTSRATIVKFWYDYRDNKAEISVEEAKLDLLCEVIPNFAVSLSNVMPKPIPAVGMERRSI